MDNVQEFFLAWVSAGHACVRQIHNEYTIAPFSVKTTGEKPKTGRKRKKKQKNVQPG
jgi:hypothetical protein